MEKISRKPDIIAMEIISKASKTRLNGRLELSGSLNFSNTSLTIEDKSSFEFVGPNFNYKWKMPTYVISGLLMPT